MLFKTVAAAAAVVPFVSARTFAIDNRAVGEATERTPFCNARSPNQGQQAEYAERIAASSSFSADSLVVPVHLHAAVSETADPEFMSVEKLGKQYEVIRDIYAPYGINLTLGDITRDDSGRYTAFQWEYDQNGGFAGTSPAMERYWRQTRTGGYDELHLYFYQDDAQPWGGQCTFPELLQGVLGPPFWHDGCHMHSDLLVDSPDPYTNQGKVP